MGVKTECYRGGADVSSEVSEDLDSNPVLLSDHKKSFNLFCFIYSFSQLQIHTKCSVNAIITLGWPWDKERKRGRQFSPFSLMHTPGHFFIPYVAHAGSSHFPSALILL